MLMSRRGAAAQSAYEAMGMGGEHYRLFEWME